MKRVLVIGVLLYTAVFAQALDDQIISIDERGADEILVVHNKFRAEAGVEPLQWSNELAIDAQKWADKLSAYEGRKIYSSKPLMQGENIWWGSANAYTFAQMVECWGSERVDYKHGIYPDNSKNGKIERISNYTQMIWRTTTHVGCAKTTAGAYDILVCRYAPKGNIDGHKPY